MIKIFSQQFLLVLLVGILIGCHKEPIKPKIIDVDPADTMWLKDDQFNFDNTNIIALDDHNNQLIVCGTNYISVLNNNGKLISKFPLKIKIPSLYTKVSFSKNYILYKTSSFDSDSNVLIISKNNPQLQLVIQKNIDGNVSGDAQLNDEDNLLIMTSDTMQLAQAHIFTIVENSSFLSATSNTFQIDVKNDSFFYYQGRIANLGKNWLVYNQIIGTQKLVRPDGSFKNIDIIFPTDLPIPIHDTLFLMETQMPPGFSVTISTDQGENWRSVFQANSSNSRWYGFGSLSHRIVLTLNGEIYQMKYDFLLGSVSMKLLRSSGLPNFYKCTTHIFANRVYSASARGVYYTNLKNFF